MAFQDAIAFLATRGVPTCLVVAAVPLVLWYATGRPNRRWPYAVALAVSALSLLLFEGVQLARLDEGNLCVA